MPGNDDPVSPRTAACPICGKPTSAAHRPFCSKRCREIDLGRWLRGVYRVETDEGPDSLSEEDR
ncbi:MAG TPA: DNA gyrase inhibitor YacG [Stellaceae bacterium]|nr:DNA gyrase inhibitor YacG [Stellaceae bacterium]